MNPEQIRWAFMTLGLNEYADESMVKHNYRMLCKKYHPDICNNEMNIQLYYQVRQAYEIAIKAIEYRKQIPNNMTGNVSGYSYYGNNANISGGRIIGNNPKVHRNYEAMRERQREDERLKNWEEANQKEKERKKYEDNLEFFSNRKLPSEAEKEKLNKIKNRIEAERIANIISMLLERNET